MFERFTEGARQLVVGAQEQAIVLSDDQIRAEHLLLAVLDAEGSPAAVVLREAGVERARLVDLVRRLGAGDEQALRGLGIDLSAVRSSVEASHGPGALDAPRRRPAGWLRRRVGIGGHVPFSPSAKRALEQSLRQALDLLQRQIGVEVVLLGLLAHDHDPAAVALGRLDVDVAEVRRRVSAVVRQAA